MRVTKIDVGSLNLKNNVLEFLLKALVDAVNVAQYGTGKVLATTGTAGYRYMPTCAGAPTGVPVQTPVGVVPMVFDSTNFKLYAYVAGAWKSTAAFA